MAVTGKEAAQSTRAARSSTPAIPATPTIPLSGPSSATLQEQTQHQIAARLRREAIARYRPLVASGAAPIRIMARMVAEIRQACREQGISEAILAGEVANRTIGDVDLRAVTEGDGETDYTTLADEFGVALPGETIQGRVASGETYLWLRERMTANERALLSQGIDLRMYDIFGVGNPILRGWLSEEMAAWGLGIPAARINLSIGAMDGLDKALRGLTHTLQSRGEPQGAVLFPAPGFNVPEWQAKTLGYRQHRVITRAEDGYKLTAAQLQQALEEAPDLRALYLTISNNPTAFAYSRQELTALLDGVVAASQRGQPLYILCDLAYIGTGIPAEDQERMRAFASPEALRQCIFVSSLSKTHSLTGERFGWVSIGDEALVARMAPAWTNTNAALPAEWQLRFMAYMDLFRERPQLEEKLHALYTLRRAALIEQLRRLDERHHLFARINLDDHATVYNWSQLRLGEDVFSLFEKTGIAGVPGSGFGYSDDYIRLSVGVIPVE